MDSAASHLDKGNKELQESINSYADGHVDRAESRYEKAMEHYDVALDLFIIE